AVDRVDVRPPQPAIHPACEVVATYQRTSKKRRHSRERVCYGVLQPSESPLTPDASNAWQLGKGLKRNHASQRNPHEDKRLIGEPAAQVFMGCHEIPDFAEAEGGGMARALAMPPEVEGQDVQAEVVERLQQPRDMTAVSPVAVTEDDVTPRVWMRDK